MFLELKQKFGRSQNTPVNSARQIFLTLAIYKI